MKKVWFTLSMSWKTILTTALISCFIAFVLFFQIGSLVKGAHPLEVQAKTTNQTYRSILDNPANAPYFIVRNTVAKVKSPTNIVNNRQLSAIIGGVCIILFYALVSLWYRPRVAILSTLLFVSSNWLLRNARLGTPEIQQTLVLALIFLPAWLRRTRHRTIALLAATAAGAYLLYIPGMIWFIVLGIIWRFKSLMTDLKKIPTGVLVLGVTIFAFLIAPISFAVMRDPEQLLRLAGIPADFHINQVLTNITDVTGRLFVRGDGDPLTNVGRMPILDVFTTFMVIVGFIEILQSRKLDRSKLVLALFLVGLALCSLGGAPQFAVLLPAIYLLAAAGIGYMLNVWLSVFPRNPLARATATILISIAVLVASAYNIANYYIAWPNTPETRATFTQRY